ncbi:hypothetical protein BDZ89DRAFT_1128232 [Hymenopellis radicata]|nr:hypothetical protein BDZ89DRAFT_1128232 [Hymenopellis radicata]
MSTKLAFTLLSLLGTGVYTYRHLRIIPMQTLHETLLWTIRSWWHRYPASGDLVNWDIGPFDGMEDYHRRELRIMDAWKFLTPFFASRGYFLYVRNLDRGILDAPSWPPPSSESSQEYPLARRFRTPSYFVFLGTRLWAVRDRLGRELVIKLVSTTSSPTPEFLALQRLNTPAARSDPRNRTIPVLDFVTWGGLVFAVMPSDAMVWISAFAVCFRTLEDSVFLWEQLLEGLEFCHEQRVANCDILDQNTLVNLLPGDVTGYGVLDLDKDCVFAYIDFGFASVVPQDMSLEDAPLRHNLFLETRAGLQGKGSTCNPFEADVLLLGAMMQRHLRMVPDVFPEGIQLMERMMGLHGERVPSASEALRDFRTIKGKMTRAMLDHKFTSQIWNRRK